MKYLKKFESRGPEVTQSMMDDIEMCFYELTDMGFNTKIGQYCVSVPNYGYRNCILVMIFKHEPNEEITKYNCWGKNYDYMIYGKLFSFDDELKSELISCIGKSEELGFDFYHIEAIESMGKDVGLSNTRVNYREGSFPKPHVRCLNASLVFFLPDTYEEEDDIWITLR